MTAPPRQRVNILVVDDHRENLLAMEATLHALDENVVTVENGADALRRLLTDDFACVLLDVQMPVMDGFETAAIMRERDATRHTPIIFLTAIHRTDLHVAKGYSVGAADYLFKPIDPDILRSKVAVFVDLYRRSREIQWQTERLRRTEEKIYARQLAELEEQGRRMQESHLKKHAFLSEMAHELRTPLNAIIGFADLLTEAPPDLPDDTRRLYLNHIMKGGKHLLRLVDETLNLIRVGASRLEFTPERMDLSQVVGETLELLSSLADRKRIQASWHVDPEIGTVFLDPSKFRQVLFNYLSNALKFTPDGGDVSVRAEACGRTFFRLEVHDSGIGIRQEDLDRIFLGAGTQRTHPSAGAGIGLALTRRIVEAQGGRVGVENHDAERGTCFYAILPKSMSDEEYASHGVTGAELRNSATMMNEA